MATYSIRPIALCGGPRDVSQYTYRMNVGTPCRTICYSWYVEGSQPRVLVDVGQTSSMSPGGAWDKDYNTPEGGLARLGLTPDDIKIIIITHLHFDHIALSSLYKKARFIVQKKELDYALNPHPIDAQLYRKETFENINLEVIDGEKEIIPGVSVFLTPGHSAGGQSVEINTAAGKAIITGFCCQLATFEQTEVMKRRGWEVAIPIIHQDVRDAYDSVLKVKRRADIIISQHDPVHMEKGRIP